MGLAKSWSENDVSNGRQLKKISHLKLDLRCPTLVGGLEHNHGTIHPFLMGKSTTNGHGIIIIYLIGGLEHDFYFP